MKTMIIEVKVFRPYKKKAIIATEASTIAEERIEIVVTRAFKRGDAINF